MADSLFSFGNQLVASSGMRQYFTESDANYQIGEALYIYDSMKEGGRKILTRFLNFIISKH